jgi:hypothetical protein
MRSGANVLVRSCDTVLGTHRVESEATALDPAPHSERCRTAKVALAMSTARARTSSGVR